MFCSTLNTTVGDQFKPKFIKLNPQHSVPTLDDNGNVLTDGHAIVTYLVSKYGKSEHASLLPSDPYLRARVDNFLHFDQGTLFHRFRISVGPIYRATVKDFDPEHVKAVLEALDFLETYLVDDYLVGNNITVADFSCVSSATSILGIFPIESSRCPKVLAWIDRLSKLPYYDEIITKNVNILSKMLLDKLAEIKASN